MMVPTKFEPAALSSPELEQGLLGAILNSNAVFDIIEPMVSADDFAEPLHAQLLKTIADTRESGGLVTLPLVIAAMGGYGAGLVAGFALAGLSADGHERLYQPVGGARGWECGGAGDQLPGQWRDGPDS